MTPFGIFGRKKKIEEKIAEKTLLDELCGDDSELKKILTMVLLLNPDRTSEMGGIDSHLEKAKEYENEKDHVRARVEYQVAGELALHEGRLAEVQKLFKKATEIDPDYNQKNVYEFLTKRENAEKALTVAKEYYRRTARSLERKLS
jgi:tetratricopeptide (TPR) repeat protein